MKRIEDQLQRAVCDLLSSYERMGKLRFAAIPNGGKRNKIEAAIMKGLGTRAGFPDLCVMFSHGPVIFFELKAPKGVVSPSQKDWMKWLNENGHESHVVRDIETIHALIKSAISQGKNNACKARNPAIQDIRTLEREKAEAWTMQSSAEESL